MNTAAKLSAYGAALALAVAGAYATGTAVGPLFTTSAVSGEHGGPCGAQGAGRGDGHSGTVAGTVIEQPGGLVGGQASQLTLSVPGDGRTAAGPEIKFLAEVPSAGSYRLFLDFSHGGVVRTAEFTVPTGPAAAGGAHEGGHR